MMKDAFLYKITRPFITFLFKIIYHPKIIGKNNIDKNSPLILAGNHTSILDCLLLISSTKRNIHFLAKKELWQGPKKIIFANMGLIPVDRSTKNPNALKEAEEYLKSNLVVGIFPEGTTEKGRGLLPFKPGAVKMAKDTKTKIVPFVISGHYKVFSKDLTIKFLKPFMVTGEIDAENEKLRNIIKKERDDYNE